MNPPTWTDQQRRNYLRYTRTERWPTLARFQLTEAEHIELLSRILRCPESEVTGHLSFIDAEVHASVRALLDRPMFRKAIESLPFTRADRVVAVGDSVTADRLGWFELLTAATSAIGSPAQLVNLGLSGNTTADVIERFDLMEASAPTHVLLMLGTNDARAHGRIRPTTMLSPEETRRNLRVLTSMIEGELAAHVTLITPPAGLQSRIDRTFTNEPVHWTETDINKLAEIVRDLDNDCADVHAAMTSGLLEELLEQDGVHPTPRGQILILETVLHQLRGPVNSARPHLPGQT